MKISYLLLAVFILHRASGAEVSPLLFDSTAVENENHWVAFPPKSPAEPYLFGFLYIDAQAGFTFHLGGNFRVESSGSLKLEPNQFERQSVFKVRMQSNPRVARLSPAQLRELDLPEQPGWLASYADKSTPEIHNLNWGRAYNHIGACQKALEFLEPAYRMIPDDERVLFELSFAYNALGRASDALPVLAKAIERRPNVFFLRREYAYALLVSAKWTEAVTQYRECLKLCPATDQNEKAEVAMNLGQALARTGAQSEADEWLAKARAWAPEGSAVSNYFKQQSRR